MPDLAVMTGLDYETFEEDWADYNAWLEEMRAEEEAQLNSEYRYNLWEDEDDDAFPF